LRTIQREAEEAVHLRRALEEERAAVAEKYASLDREAERRERERASTFERELLEAVEEFERRSREMVQKMEDLATRSRLEREAQKRAAELKREAQRAARAASASSSSIGSSARGVRVMRDGRPVEASARQQEQPAPDPAARSVPSREIRVGDRVRLRSFGSEGVVETLHGEDAEVRVKSLRFREKVSNLDLLEAAPPPAESGRAAMLKKVSRGTEVRLTAPGEAIHSEINVIGRTTDEAVEEVDKFLDQAVMSGLHHVRIVHGMGTGALRKAIAELLRGHPHVARYATAPQDQGGAGATVVELEQ
jgi:DNA mismatch repair protein MutS2